MLGLCFVSQKAVCRKIILESVLEASRWRHATRIISQQQQPIKLRLENIRKEEINPKMIRNRRTQVTSGYRKSNIIVGLEILRHKFLIE